MKVEARQSLICDLVHAGDRGKLNLLGLFDWFYVGSFDQDLPPFFVHTTLDIKQGEVSFGSARIVMQVVSADGTFMQKGFDEVFPAPPEALWRDGEISAQIYARIAEIKIPCPGRYFVEILIDGQKVERVPFRASKLEEYHGK